MRSRAIRLDSFIAYEENGDIISWTPDYPSLRGFLDPLDILCQKTLIHADSSNSLAVFDLTDPARPVEQGFLQSNLLYGPNRLWIMGNKA